MDASATCVICGHEVGTDEEYATHLGEAHGLFDADGTRTQLEPVAVGAAELRASEMGAHAFASDAPAEASPQATLPQTPGPADRVGGVTTPAPVDRPTEREQCTEHPGATAAGICRSCARAFCAPCLLHPNGPESPPLCLACALAVGGVRTRNAPPKVAPGEAVVDQKERKAIRKTTRRIIWTGFATQLLIGFLLLSSTIELADYLIYGSLVIFGFYLLVLITVLMRLTVSGVRPRWKVGNPAVGAAIGAASGLALALVLIVLLGGEGSDTALVSEGSAAALFLGAIVPVVCAPFIEELLFRGVLAESFRARGPWVAMAASSFFFAIWHLRFLGVPYYFLAGCFLFALYWKRGLAASIAGHAAFNGTLTVVAMLTLLAPAHTLSRLGVTMRAPGTWDKVGNAEVLDAADLSLQGPSLATVGVGHLDSDIVLNPDQALDVVQRRSAVPGFVEYSAASMRHQNLPAGPAVRSRATILGRDVDLTVLTKGTRVWIVAFATAGSDRAEGDFEPMLRSLRLPDTPAQ